MRAIQCPNCKGSLDNISVDETQTVCSYCRTTIDLSEPKRDSDVQTIQVNFGSNVEVFLEKGFILLEEREWEKAEQNFRTVLHSHPKSAEAYLGLLLAERKLDNEEELKNVPLLSDNTNFKMALRFSEGDLKHRLEKHMEMATQRVKENAEIFDEAMNKVGCLMPLILGVPIGIVLAEIWFLIFWEGFALINLGILDDWMTTGWTYVGLVIAYLFGILMAWAALHNRAESKIKKQRKTSNED